MRTSLTWPLAAVVGIVAANSASLDLAGPDGTIRLRVGTDETGHLVYDVQAGGRQRLRTAPAGIIVNGIDLGAGIELGQPTAREIHETFPWRGNKTVATNHCVAAAIPVRASAGGEAWTLEVRVFNDGAAWRYRVPGTGTRRVNGEVTAWHLPAEAEVWFQTNTGNYEGAYQSARADNVPLAVDVQGRRQPVHLGPPVTAVFPDGWSGLISEASLFNYSGLTLRPAGDGRLRAAFQDDPEGWEQTGEIVSPWRIMVLVPDLNALVNSDLIPALCDPPDPTLFTDGPNTEWIKPGKAPCTWMVFGNDGAAWERQKWFVDVSAAIGCEYLLVDGGWRSEKWGWLKDGGDLWARAAELCDYAAGRDVGIFLWHAFPEGRDDSPGLTSVEAREDFFRRCAQAGVKGVKIDFFDSESKATIDAYEDLLRRAAKYRLMVNFHGANKPTGEARTWPNEITREGIREQEYLLWGALPLTHYGALPFTRMAVGHADFLPGYVQPRFLKNTSLIFQMASVVVFTSPFLCWPDNPEAYLDRPLLSFIRSVPVTWDETRVLSGSGIGDAVIFARRHGEAWYVAALNCRDEPRRLALDLSSLSLEGTRMDRYEDAGENGCRLETQIDPPAEGRLTVALRAGGGFLARFAPPRELPGWH